jgi:hypothetical protein
MAMPYQKVRSHLLFSGWEWLSTTLEIPQQLKRAGSARWAFTLLSDFSVESKEPSKL